MSTHGSNDAPHGRLAALALDNRTIRRNQEGTWQRRRNGRLQRNVSMPAGPNAVPQVPPPAATAAAEPAPAQVQLAVAKVPAEVPRDRPVEQVTKKSPRDTLASSPASSLHSSPDGRSAAHPLVDRTNQQSQEAHMNQRIEELIAQAGMESEVTELREHFKGLQRKADGFEKAKLGPDSSVRKQGEWTTLKQSCHRCDALLDRNLDIEAVRRELGLAPADPKVAHAVTVAAAAPENTPPAVAAAAAKPDPPQVPVDVAVPADVPCEPCVEQVTGESLRDAKGRNGMYTGTILRDTGKPHGVGKMMYDSGDEYDGDWKHGYFHGQGVYTWNEGDTYEGEYKHGIRDGCGVYVWKTGGNRYEGQWQDGKRNGLGICTLENGEKYVGVWEDSKRHDHVVFTYADGRTVLRTFENGDGRKL